MFSQRYARQIALWGEEAQEKLRRSSVLIVGLGGLGSAAALYAAAAGVGRVILVDDDRVEESDLNRQVLHWTLDLGRPKVESAAEKLKMLNPETTVEAERQRLSSLQQAMELVERADVVVDCLDNWGGRFLLNEACVRARKPLVHAAVEGVAGWLTVLKPPEGPCLQCLFPRPPAERHAVPVIGPMPGVFGSMEAFEALKLITGFGKPLIGRMLFLDLALGEFETIRVSRRADCPTCGGLRRSS